ncbi:hypothetical protein HKX48_004799 [Thoreauomyces humboldtii]|nr:hypothetical protein HKX48_004799 [Thoreauomyces humboldtii]
MDDEPGPTDHVPPQSPLDNTLDPSEPSPTYSTLSSEAAWELRRLHYRESRQRDAEENRPEVPVHVANLHVLGGPLAGTLFPVFTGINFIGYGSEPVDIALPVAGVSTFHALLDISRNMQEQFIEDLSSTNGTTLGRYQGGHRLRSYCLYQLKAGKLLRFSNVDCRYEPVVAVTDLGEPPQHLGSIQKTQESTPSVADDESLADDRYDEPDRHDASQTDIQLLHPASAISTFSDHDDVSASPQLIEILSQDPDLVSDVQESEGEDAVRSEWSSVEPDRLATLKQEPVPTIVLKEIHQQHDQSPGAILVTEPAPLSAFAAALTAELEALSGESSPVQHAIDVPESTEVSPKKEADPIPAASAVLRESILAPDTSFSTPSRQASDETFDDSSTGIIRPKNTKALTSKSVRKATEEELLLASERRISSGGTSGAGSADASSRGSPAIRPSTVPSKRRNRTSFVAAEADGDTLKTEPSGTEPKKANKRKKATSLGAVSTPSETKAKTHRASAAPKTSKPCEQTPPTAPSDSLARPAAGTTTSIQKKSGKRAREASEATTAPAEPKRSDEKKPPRKAKKRIASQSATEDHVQPDPVEQGTPSSSQIRRDGRSPRTPRRTKTVTVLFAGVSDPALSKVVESLEGKISPEWQRCTHLVTDRIRRSVRFLCAMGSGKHIVNRKWLDDSKKAGKFIDELPYLLKDSKTEEQYDFDFVDSVIRARHPELRIFHNLRFFSTPRVKPARPELAEILAASGGELIEVLPEEPDPTLIIIGSLDDGDEITELKVAGYPVVHSNEFVLSGLLRMEVDFESPGPHFLQDPDSGVYNFDPYLKDIVQPEDFNYEALPGYMIASEDESAYAIAADTGRRYFSSTSSFTGILSKIYLLVSNGRSINVDDFSRDFSDKPGCFTKSARAPTSVILRYRDGVYAIDSEKSEKEQDWNILQTLGKSMEKMLTATPAEFAMFRKENSSALRPQDMDNDYHRFALVESFLLRAQIDCMHPDLPNKSFDLKTRATVAVRMNPLDYSENLDYKINTLEGDILSFEREDHDMLRSAFLKYSFQARVGGMDGVFVCYHNTSEVFGFQYLSLKLMDRWLAGNSFCAEQSFAISIKLLETLLDAATAEFPKQDINVSIGQKEDRQPLICWVESRSAEPAEPIKFEVFVRNRINGKVVHTPLKLADDSSDDWEIDYTLTKANLPLQQRRRQYKEFRNACINLSQAPRSANRDYIRDLRRQAGLPVKSNRRSKLKY